MTDQGSPLKEGKRELMRHWAEEMSKQRDAVMRRRELYVERYAALSKEGHPSPHEAIRAMSSF